MRREQSGGQSEEQSGEKREKREEWEEWEEWSAAWQLETGESVKGDL